MSAEIVNKIDGAPNPASGGEDPGQPPASRRGSPAAGGAPAPGSRRGSPAAGGAPAPGSRRGSQVAGGAPAPGSRRGSQVAGGAPAPGSRRESQVAAGAPDAVNKRESQVAAGAPAPGSRRGSQVAGGAPAPGSRRESQVAAGAPDAVNKRESQVAAGAPDPASPLVTAGPDPVSPVVATGPDELFPVDPGAPEPGNKRVTIAQEPSEERSRRASVASGRIQDDGTAAPVDAHNAEFSYYCAVLRTYAPSLSREYDKMTTRMWMKKLLGPEYHPTVLKPKRNKYLLYLSITICNDESYGIFKQEPPYGKLPEINEIPFNVNVFPPAEWEADGQWVHTITDLPDDLKISACYLHGTGECPDDENLAAALDSEFQFFLWLSKPYVALLPDPEEKTTAACWIRLLCGVAYERGRCVDLKNIRNDYMQTLLGYVHDLRVEGPFRLMPPAGPLPPLTMLYEGCKDNFGDPAGSQAEEFLALQRLPESGAFAYINVTGELFGNI